MTLLVWGMIGAGTVVLTTGLILVGPRRAVALGAGKLLVLAPVFEATALSIFAAEHFLAARALSGIVPRWIPGALFWTYFVGAALLAAAISLITWRFVRWSALLLALLFLIIIVTIDLPNLPSHLHERLFWTLTMRESAFAGGAMVLAGSQWPLSRLVAAALVNVGRFLIAFILVFYSIEQFLFPHFVPGVPLEKLTPAWIPVPILIAYGVGAVLLLAGIGLMIPRIHRIAAATGGAALILLTVVFYIPIFITEMYSPLALEGMNYVGDTLLFAATVTLTGWGVDSPRTQLQNLPR